MRRCVNIDNNLSAAIEPQVTQQVCMPECNMALSCTHVQSAYAARWELTDADSYYPCALHDLEHPPQRLYGIGNPDVLQKPCISIIGARDATPYGKSLAQLAGRISAECGLTVVSGGAKGCDYAALRAALDAQGNICIVSGCGADKVYPSSSKDIFEEAKDGRGCVVALETWGSSPKRYAFPKRNKIIAALSRVLIICEANHKSGTMSTAETAVQLNRMLYACPGSIFSPLSNGTNALIANGAAIITSEKDLEERISLDFNSLRLTCESLKPHLGKIMSALFANPMRADDLAQQLDEQIITILSTLGDFEAQGLVKRLIDGRFSPTSQAYLYYGKKSEDSL